VDGRVRGFQMVEFVNDAITQLPASTANISVSLWYSNDTIRDIEMV